MKQNWKMIMFKHTINKKSKKHFKKRVEWFITNKPKMSPYRKHLYLDLLIEEYEEYLPYSKYCCDSKYQMVDYINKRIRKRNLV